jgi:predicted short-subunit dehydrogenase-like oxidoreductase (DUF2520 family)
VTSASPGALALVGPGRAGAALTVALARAGWKVRAVAGRSPERDSTRSAAERFHCPATHVRDVAAGAQLVIIAVPDAAIPDVAAALGASPSLVAGTLVVHLAGSFGVDALATLAVARPDVRLGALHPLQTLPGADEGAARLAGSWCAVAGDAAVTELALAIGCHPFVIDDDQRGRYHAAACIAGNHLVALLGQVERLATAAGVPLDAFLPLVRAAVDNAAALGPAAALTGPVSRNDVDTVARHIDALPVDERDAYRAMAAAALTLTGRDAPELRALLAPNEAASR